MKKFFSFFGAVLAGAGDEERVSVFNWERDMITVENADTFFDTLSEYSICAAYQYHMKKVSRPKNIKTRLGNVLKACVMCAIENAFFRSTAFIGYRKRKLVWGKIKRAKQFKDAQCRMYIRRNVKTRTCFGFLYMIRLFKDVFKKYFRHLTESIFRYVLGN